MTETFRGAEVAGFQAAEIDDEFFQDDAGIDLPEFQGVVAELFERVVGVAVADGVFDGGFPVFERVVGEDVDDLGRLIVEGDGVAEAAAGDEGEGGGDDGGDVDVASVEEVDAVFEMGGIGGRGGAWGGDGEEGHGREGAAVVGDFFPAGAAVGFCGVVFGFDGDVAVGFDEALEGVGGDIGGADGVDFDGDWGGAWSADEDAGFGGRGGQMIPIDGDFKPLFLCDRAGGGVEEDPGGGCFGGEFEGDAAAVEDVDGACLTIDGIECGECCFFGGAGPCGWGAFNCDTDCGGGWNCDFVDFGHCVSRRFLPAGVTDVGLVHHVVPLAVGDGVVEGGGEVGVGLEESTGLFGEVVGAGAALGGVEVVQSGGDVELRHGGGGFGGVDDEFVEGVAAVLRGEFC